MLWACNYNPHLGPVGVRTSSFGPRQCVYQYLWRDETVTSTKTVLIDFNEEVRRIQTDCKS